MSELMNLDIEIWHHRQVPMLENELGLGLRNRCCGLRSILHVAKLDQVSVYLVYVYVVT